MPNIIKLLRVKVRDLRASRFEIGHVKDTLEVRGRLPVEDLQTFNQGDDLFRLTGKTADGTIEFFVPGGHELKIERESLDIGAWNRDSPRYAATKYTGD